MKSSNYSYNKTIAAIRDGASVNFQDLRNKYVTSNTKKNDSTYQRIDAELKQLRKHKPVNKERILELREELQLAKKEMKSVKNEGVHEWELKTPKEIRAEAVKDVCKAYKTMFTNLKKGNIKRSQIRYRVRKSVQQCLAIPKNFLSNRQGILQLAPTFFGEEKFISMGKRNIKKYRHLEIQHDCRLVKKHNQYWLYIPVEAAEVPSNLSWKKYSGVDPGIRTFMTTFGNGGCYEYEHNENKIKNIDKKLKSYKTRHIRKRSYLKQERKKEHCIDEIHWKTITELLRRNDVLFYGDIQSHNIVRGKKNRTLNKDTNNLKFYQFKQRLQFKASEKGKKVIVVKEHYTTKTCSFCGTMNEPGASKVYHCSNCKRKVGRDVNAAKNILMKELIKHV